MAAYNWILSHLQPDYVQTMINSSPNAVNDYLYLLV